MIGAIYAKITRSDPSIEQGTEMLLARSSLSEMRTRQAYSIWMNHAGIRQVTNDFEKTQQQGFLIIAMKVAYRNEEFVRKGRHLRRESLAFFG